MRISSFQSARLSSRCAAATVAGVRPGDAGMRRALSSLSLSGSTRLWRREEHALTRTRIAL
jgi:hypothetical protein